MAKLTDWIRKAIDDVVDPEKVHRIDHLVQTMHAGLQSEGQRFSLASIAKSGDFTENDLEIAKQRVYRTILERGWSDGKLSTGQQKVARWVARCLEIPVAQSKKMNIEFAKHHFAISLARALDDGVLSEDEEFDLSQIAVSVGLSMPDFARTFFHTEGERFLRGVFMACVADNQLSQREWDLLLATTQKLGFSQAEMLEAIKAQSRQFVEHVLADAKSDGRLSDQEDASLRWIVGNLRLSPEYCRYVESEVSLLRKLTNIEDGKLPSEPPPRGVAIRAGEIVHFHGRAIWRHVRMLKAGPKSDDHQGTVTLTDNRLIFSSPTKSQTVRYRRLVACSGDSDRIETQVEGKPASTYFLAKRSQIPFAIFRIAVAMANQTKVAKPDAARSRHIPREVRQRVWQRYGGRCAECSADDYLEFDHVIPVAKGGSNSDANIQLLCRRCNLKKSDHI